MSRQINQPVGQIKLTNVAVVRCNKAGKRFEIACYRNKVMDYRSGLEKDLSEVLQAERIFTNVSKGQFAKSADLKKAFGTTDEEEIAKVILEEGQSLQVSDLERNQQIQSTISQIASWIASNCVHPDKQRPYTVSQIKHLLGKNFTVQTHKPLKKQCLDAVKFLKNEIPIERAKMELSIQYEAVHDATVSAAVQRLSDQCTLVPAKCQPPPASPAVLVVQADPSLYRELDELSKSVQGHLEILQQVVSVQGGDVDLDQEIIQRMAPQANDKKTKDTGVVEQVTLAVDQINLDNQQQQQQQTRGSSGQEKNSGSSENGGGDDDGPVLVDRKAQKKAAKKAKKAQRRLHHYDDDDDDDGDKEVAYEQEAAAAATADAPKATLGGATEPTPPAGSKSCNTCGGAFLSTSDYRAHFRTDWHRFNQKLKLKGQAPVSQEEFKLCDAETFFGQFDG